MWEMWWFQMRSTRQIGGRWFRRLHHRWFSSAGPRHRYSDNAVDFQFQGQVMSVVAANTTVAIDMVVVNHALSPNGWLVGITCANQSAEGHLDPAISALQRWAQSGVEVDVTVVDFGTGEALIRMMADECLLLKPTSSAGLTWWLQVI
jgi:hypothetical protein